MRKYIGFLFLTFLLVSSCVDSRYDEMVNDTAYFQKSNLQQQTVTVMNADDYVYNIWIHKGGFFQNKFAGSLMLDYNYLEKYNTENGTDYEMLDESYFSFERSFVIEEGVNEVAIPFTLKTEKLLQDFGYKTFYIPFSVNSLTPNGDIYAEKSQFILALTLQEPKLKIDGENIGTKSVDINSIGGTTEFDITAMLDVVTTEDLEVLYTIGSDLLSGEQNLLQTGYSMKESVTMVTGEQYAENYLTIDPSAIPNGRWTLPIRMYTTNDKIQIVDGASTFILTVIKGNLDNEVVFEGEYVQGNEIIIPSDLLQSTEVGSLIAGLDYSKYEVSLKGTDADSWLKCDFDRSSGKISINPTVKNETTNQENVATIVVHSKETLLDKEIVVRQCMKDYGVILNKSYWNIELENSDKVTYGGSTAPGGLKGLHDNVWSPNKSNRLYVEFNSSENKVVLVIDLGENPYQYNNVGLMPRLEWVGQSPKKVKIELSDDKSAWTAFYDGEGFKESELKENGGFKTNCYEGMIKWFDVSTNGTAVNHRYVRLTMSESTWDSKYFSFDEIFVSKK